MIAQLDKGIASPRFDVRVKFACLLVYFVAALHAATPASLAICTAAAIVALVVANVRLTAVLRAVRPFAVVIVFTALVQLLVLPWDEALRQAASMTVSLLCVVSVSIAFMRRTPPDQLVDGVGWVLRPLRRRGYRADAFLLSLCIALRFVPVLVGDFSRLKAAQAARHAAFGGTVRERLTAYTRLFPPLVRSSFRRADSLADSFLSRCFGNGGTARTSLRPMSIAAPDVLLALVTTVLCTVVFLV